MPKLAIYSPNLGVPSETFIKRHMEDIAPGNTVVIAASREPLKYGNWFVDCPTFILNNKESIFLNVKKKIVLTLLEVLHLKSPGNPYYNKALESFLIENNVKVMLGEFLDYSTTIIDLAKKLNIKLYAHAHGFDVSARLNEKFWKREYLRFNKIAGIITISEYSKAKLVKLGLKKELIHVISCGIKLPADFKKVRSSDYIKCIAVGRMVAKKAPLLLLESFRLALQKNNLLRLDYIGAGKLFKQASEFVALHKLEDKIKLHGVMENDAVINMMKEADIFLQHSITCPETGDQEGLPVAVLEGMAHYLPVVSTFHAGIPEAVINNESGLLVKEGDTAAMAEAIISLAENQDLRIKMGEEGRRRIANSFTWDIEKSSLLKVMNKGNEIS